MKQGDKGKYQTQSFRFIDTFWNHVLWFYITLGMYKIGLYCILKFIYYTLFIHFVFKEYCFKQNQHVVKKDSDCSCALSYKQNIYIK